MTLEEIKKLIDIAIENTLNENPVLPFNVSERAWAHRLAFNMENITDHPFYGWNIDCEYNMDGTLVKKLEGIKACDVQKKTDRIFPDIIVHIRNSDKNLLVVEIKKNDACDPCDKLKLELFTKSNGDYKYEFGLYINIEDNKFTKTWYRGGDVVGETCLEY